MSQQAADEKVSDAESKHAAVQAAQANLGQLEAMENFKHIVAPFDGIVTARTTDIGNLVNPGSASGRALFEISDLHKVRIYVQMPQAFAGALRPGLKADALLPQHPDQTFEATVVGTSNSFAEASRTVSVQLQADNENGALWPGSYTEVTFHVPADPHVRAAARDRARVRSARHAGRDPGAATARCCSSRSSSAATSATRRKSSPA